VPNPPSGPATSPAATARLEKRPREVSPQERAEGHYRDALARMTADQNTQAAAELEEALAAWPAHSAARDLLAGIWLRQGRRAAVESLLLEGRRVDPGYLPFTMMLARLYVDGGAESRALALLESVQGASAHDPEYLGFLAALLQRAQHHPEAAAAYRAALALRPAEARWWLGLGISLEAMQERSAASQAYARALAGAGLSPDLERYAHARQSALAARP
jgi:MSHA biogenesis protein MshN